MRSDLTPAQAERAKSLAGTMKRRALAEMLEIPEWRLARWARRTQTHVGMRRKYPLTLVRALLNFYERHGVVATRERFPGVNVASILATYRGQFEPRQYKWVWREILEMVKMGGLVSREAQVRFFKGRHGPRSIKSAWRRHLGRNQNSYLHGLPRSKASLFTDDAEFIRVQRDGRHYYVCLWTEIEKKLRPDAPAFIRECVASMSQLQMWLWSSDHPDRRIKTLIHRREK